MPSRFETPGKNTVREHWNTPLLKYIYNKYGMRYRYMGLPGTDLIDLKLWKDMIEEIIAFEMPSEGLDERGNIKQLKKNLELIKIPSQVYYGSIEQVVLQRIDLDGQEYKQSKIITLYNLDFCDEITSKINVGGAKKCFRFELIRQLLTDQHECFKSSNGSGLFLFLITARNQTHSKKIIEYLFDIEDYSISDNLYTQTYKYVEVAQGANPIPFPPKEKNLIGTHGWALKAFIFDTIISSYFPTPHISALIFPMIKYTGMPVSSKTSSPMLHYMILCKFEAPELPRPRIVPPKYLLKSSLEVDNGNIKLSKEAGETQNSEVDSVKFFQKYESSFFS